MFQHVPVTNSLHFKRSPHLLVLAGGAIGVLLRQLHGAATPHGECQPRRRGGNVGHDPSVVQEDGVKQHENTNAQEIIATRYEAVHEVLDGPGEKW